MIIIPFKQYVLLLSFFISLLQKRNQRWKSFEPKVQRSTTEENPKINPEEKFIEEKNKER